MEKRAVASPPLRDCLPPCLASPANKELPCAPYLISLAVGVLAGSIYGSAQCSVASTSGHRTDRPARDAPRRTVGSARQTLRPGPAGCAP